jgi:hypothetical protein
MIQVDFRKLIIWLLPVNLRTGRHVAWLLALLSPLQTRYTLFNARRAASIYMLGITPQVCCLEKMLNDRYDPDLRRINIADNSRMQRVYLYLEDEQKPLYIPLASEDPTVYLGTMAEMEAREADFVVNVPYAVAYNEPEMRGLLDTYKLAGKMYDIVTTI